MPLMTVMQSPLLIAIAIPVLVVVLITLDTRLVVSPVNPGRLMPTDRPKLRPNTVLVPHPSLMTVKLLVIVLLLVVLL